MSDIVSRHRIAETIVLVDICLSTIIIAGYQLQYSLAVSLIDQCFFEHLICFVSKQCFHMRVLLFRVSQKLPGRLRRLNSVCETALNNIIVTIHPSRYIGIDIARATNGTYLPLIVFSPAETAFFIWDSGVGEKFTLNMRRIVGDGWQSCFFAC